ncbi:SDR family NAD(P)-dependent oxidoreductase [Kitasatospora aureofaciens]|uniref:SDR family NAD(P)-dependent oxidoreductase n=1 Tax=Kitasatospora aureofaciens TaxID=1894 RepID=UPI0036F480D0
MDLNLSDRRALVTASTGGIGREIAVSLAREGAHVVINGRSSGSIAAALEYVRARVPSASLEGVMADNSTADGASRTAAAVPDVDILINNLGIYEAAGLFSESDEAWLRMFNVNVMSAVRLSRHYMPRMLASGRGRIVLMASEAAVMPAPDMAAYSATKTMLLSLSRSLAELTKGTEVTVNAITAGSTRTEGVVGLLRQLYPDRPEDEAERAFMESGGHRATSLIQRLITPEEIADLVTYVCSPRASAINGAALRIDGGLVRSVF